MFSASAHIATSDYQPKLQLQSGSWRVTRSRKKIVDGVLRAVVEVAPMNAEQLVHLGVRIPTQLAQKLELHALEDGRTVSSLVRKILNAACSTPRSGSGTIEGSIDCALGKCGKPARSIRLSRK